MPRTKSTTKAEENGKLAKTEEVKGDATTAPVTQETILIETENSNQALSQEALEIINDASETLGANPHQLLHLVVSDALVGKGEKVALIKSLADRRKAKRTAVERTRHDLELQQEQLKRSQELLDSQIEALGRF